MDFKGSPLIGSRGKAPRLASSPHHTDWLRHVLRVSGPAAEMAAFRAAAAGAAAIPWHLDLDHEEARLFAPMATLGTGARVLARELREAIEIHHARVLAQVATSRICPLDLHRLLPVPDRVLRLGPDDPAAQSWLASNWGTQQALRHVRVLEESRPRRTAKLAYEFFSADWSPWQALLRLRAAWVTLVLDLQPDYGDG